MTTPPAMPELPEGVTLEDLLIPLRAALDTCHDTDWTLRQFKTHITHALSALATLQAQPAEVSDDVISRLWSWSATPEAERTATTQQHAFAYALLALRPQSKPVGEAATMPGTSDFTMACFHADKVPVGTKLYIEALRPQAVPMTEEADPCPGCRKGGVCRTPKCGRLKLPIDHPYRTGITAPAGGEG